MSTKLGMVRCRVGWKLRHSKLKFICRRCFQYSLSLARTTMLSLLLEKQELSPRFFLVDSAFLSIEFAFGVHSLILNLNVSQSVISSHVPFVSSVRNYLYRDLEYTRSIPQCTRIRQMGYMWSSQVSTHLVHGSTTINDLCKDHWKQNQSTLDLSKGLRWETYSMPIFPNCMSFRTLSASLPGDLCFQSDDQMEDRFFEIRTRQILVHHLSELEHNWLSHSLQTAVESLVQQSNLSHPCSI